MIGARALVTLFVGGMVAGCFTPPIPPPPLVPIHEALLLAEPFSVVEVRVHHVEGRPPEPGALSTLADALRATLLKRAVEVVVDPEPMAPLPDALTESDLVVAISEHRASHAAPPLDTFVLDVFYVNGRLEQEAPAHDAVGYFFFDAILVFKDVYTGSTVGAPGVGPRVPVPEYDRLSVEKFERSVLVHEAGHALGLVNLMLPMVTPREHPQSSGHSDRPRSVMYPLVVKPTTLGEHVADNVAHPYRFDEHDLADIRAFQEAATAVKATR